MQTPSPLAHTPASSNTASHWPPLEEGKSLFRSFVKQTSLIALTAICAILAAPLAKAQTTLAAGDVAVIGYNASGTPDTIALLILKDLTAGTVFYVSDNEVASDGGTAFADTNEAEATFTVQAGQTVPAGTVVVLPWGNQAVTSSVYTWTGHTAGGLGASGGVSLDDGIYIYTGTSATALTPTAFIYYVKGSSSTASNSGNRPAGLVAGTTFISPTSNATRYKTTGATYSGTQAALLTAIGDTAANWQAGAPGAAGDWTFSLGSLPAVTLSVSSTTGTETAATAITVTATASSAVSGNQTVSLAVSGTGITTGDYTLSGSTITILNGATTGNATFTILDDSEVEGTETATLTISSPSSGITLGATTTQNIVITDTPPALAAPVFTTQPAASQSISFNATATLSALASGNPTPTYQWYQGNSGDTANPVNGATSASFTTPALSANATYWVRATNSQGTADSNSASVTVQLSAVSSLSALTISSGSLSPAFASGNLSYTASVTNATASITVTPSATNSFASIQVRVNGGTYAGVTSGNASSALALNEGANTVDMLVTAQDTTTTTYTVTVTRAAATVPSVLTLGDLMFTAMNADEDGFAMVALKDIPANTTVYFTDNEWQETPVGSGTYAFNAGEGYFQWVTGASVISAGTVIRFSAVDSTTLLSASVGTFSRATVTGNTNWGLSTGAETIYAYVADSVTSTPTFLSAICNQSYSTTNNTTGVLTNTGLSVGNGALQTGYSNGSDFAEFNASRSNQSTYAAYLPIISNVTNWTVDILDGTFTTTVPNTTAFTLSGAPVTPTVNLSVSANAGSEAGLTAITVTATASASVTGDQTVSLVVTGTGITAGDYTLSNATITIPGGTTTGTVTFTVQNDTLLEGTETATLTISSPSAGILLGATTSQNVAITDNDASIDLSKYIRVGRYDLPEPTRTTAPSGNLLCSEASGVTYNWDTNTLFIVDDEGTAITEVTKTGALVGTMTIPAGNGTTDFYDTEGITYIGGGQFVLVSERNRQAVKFTYAAGTTLDRATAQTVTLGTTIGNIGLEGASYDPLTAGFIFVKESGPQGIFQTTIDFAAGTASNGSPSTVNSINLFTPSLAGLEDMSDVFAFSNIPSLTGQPQESHLLILSQESGLVRNVDRAGNILSTLTLVADADNPLTIQNQTHEGITMDRDGFIYVVSESGGGDPAHPQLWVYAPSTVTNAAPTALSLSTATTTIPENTSTASATKMAILVVTDADGVGTNTLSVSGADAASFEIIGSGLYLKAGTSLSFATKPSYSVTVNVEDTAVGATPDASANFTLNLTAVGGGSSFIRITEVSPWSSTAANSPLAADWFELTNTGTVAVDITGWKIDDDSASFASGTALSGVTSIAPGESVVFVEGQTKVADFITHWFGGVPPSGLKVGYYSGPGLGAGGDAVYIFDSATNVVANVTVGASSASAPFRTFDNTAGLNNATITQLSALGTNGAFTPVTSINEIGSPGSATLATAVLVSIVATDATAAETGSDTGTFRITRTGSTTLALDVVISIATGAGHATSADYTPSLASTVTIPAGESFVDVTITPVDDGLEELAETVTLTLGDTGSYDVGSPASATITIAASFTPVQNWRQTFFNTTANTGLTADTADFDGDGVANLLEYALGGDPTVASTAEGTGLLPVGTVADASDALLSDRFSLAFLLDNPNPTGLTYTVEATSDLVTWSPVASKTGAGAWTWVGGGTSRIVTSGTTAITVKVGDLVPTDGNPRRMMRLKVATP